jgi:hypothetical protein
MPSAMPFETARRLTGIAVGLVITLGSTPAIARAQGRGISGCSVVERIDCTMVHRRDGPPRQEREWPTAIVLWRMPPDLAFRAAASAREDSALERYRARVDSASRRYRALRRAAEDSGWRFMGGQEGAVIQELVIDSTDSRLRVRDRIFAIPGRDSALVVMVDMTRDPANTPVIVGHAYVPAQLPEGYWPKHWTSGDTIFSVRPRNADQMLTRLLRTNPSIAAFLDGRSR